MRARQATRLALLLPVLALTVASASAATYPQPPAVSPFTTTGFIQAATLDSATNVLSGGTVTLNGTTVVIPANLIVQMPATALSWQELWSLAPLPWGLTSAGGNGQTGLALTDSFTDPATGAVTRPLTPVEITIQGNRIVDATRGDIYVAGIVFMSKEFLNAGQGIINFIDYAKGEIHVGGPTLGLPSAGDARIQINDPVGRYGRRMSPDVRFTADTDNPTIRAQTGYPMCIPRSTSDPTVSQAELDPACPQANRPFDTSTPKGYVGNFTIGQTANPAPPRPGVINALAPADLHGDPTQMAPFEVGDFIDYSGMLVQDPATPGVAGQYISAWQIVAHLGIYTSPGIDPAYIAIDLTLIGAGGTPINSPIAVPEEVTTRIRTRGFFTDPTRTIDLFAVKVDPCTGAETNSLLFASIPNQTGGIPWGRFRDIDQIGTFPLTREWRAQYSLTLGQNPVTTPLPNGLLPDQYKIPVSTYITPENTVYGDPNLVAVPQNFQDFPFLVNGSGPWRGNTANIVSQLTPFPLTNSIPGLTPQVPPSAPSCAAPTSLAPSALISPLNQTVTAVTPVTLDATHSTDPNSPPLLPLSFTWRQTSGPAVTLSLPPLPAPQDGPQQTFTAPPVTANTTLTFEVTVTNTAKLSATATTQVLVTPNPVARDSIVITGATYASKRDVLNVSATSSAVCGTAILTLTAALSDGTTFGPVNMVFQKSPCNYTFTSSKSVFPAPLSVTVISSLGGSAASIVIIK